MSDAMENERRPFAQNVTWLLSGQLVAKLASFAFVVIVARAVGVREYGFFTFAISFVPLFLVFGGLGVDLAAVREIAREPARVSELFASGFVVRLGAAVLGLMIALALGPLFLHDPQALVVLVIVAIALFIDEMATYIATVFKAFERLQFHALIVVVNRIVSTLLALAAALLDAGIVVIMVTYLVGSVGALVYAVFALKRFFPPIELRARSRQAIRDFLRSSGPLGLAGVLNMALFRIDAVMVEAMRGVVAVGLYGIAYRFFESFLFVSWNIPHATLPRISRAGPGEESTRLFNLAVALCFAFYMPLAVGSIFLSDWVVESLFGDRYEAAAAAVPWLMGSGVFYALAYQARVVFMGVAKMRPIIWVALAALVFNVGLNLVLIPRMGFKGAAIATFAAEVLEALALIALAHSAGVSLRLSRMTFVPLVAAAIMGGALWASSLDGARGVVLAVLVYPAALILASRVLAPDESRQALEIIRRRRAKPSDVAAGPLG
jgi:O-antigen/teichoic acid export membrane protein